MCGINTKDFLNYIFHCGVIEVAGFANITLIIFHIITRFLLIYAQVSLKFAKVLTPVWRLFANLSQ